MELYSEKAFRVVFYGCLLMVAFCVACAIMTVSLSNWGQGDIYVKETIVGDGDWRTHHEGKLSEESGGHGAHLDYKYDKLVDESGTQEQNLEVTIEGGDGSRWNFVRLGADQVAGHNTVNIYIGSISGTAYVKNGMKVSYNEANESREEFESTIEVDTLDGNATMRFDVVQWQGAGEPVPVYDEETGNFSHYDGGESFGKPVSISDLDMVGSFLVNQFVALKEPIPPDGDWLGFCKKVEGQDEFPDGFKVVPSAMVYDWKNGTGWNYNDSKIYQIDV